MVADATSETFRIRVHIDVDALRGLRHGCAGRVQLVPSYRRGGIWFRIRRPRWARDWDRRRRARRRR